MAVVSKNRSGRNDSLDSFVQDVGRNVLGEGKTLTGVKSRFVDSGIASLMVTSFVVTTNRSRSCERASVFLEAELRQPGDDVLTEAGEIFGDGSSPSCLRLSLFG